ncbi:MAG: site-specific DNA-methyltransferase [Verrucomicrobia bacterium]|nr:site-specific DNA-methyltransferase [Verrucomicrobiota bacterium]
MTANPPDSLSPFLDRVICGDNCETLAAMPAESVDLVVTSPPYDDLRTYGGHSWDFDGVARELTRVLKPGGVIVWVVNDATVNGSETGTSMKQALGFMDSGLRLHDTMIWEKVNVVPSVAVMQSRYEQCWEYMFVLSKGKPKTCNHIREPKTYMDTRKTHQGHRKANGEFGELKVSQRTDKILRNLWRIKTGGGHAGDATCHDHPAVFPERLAKDHVATWSNPGDVVLDPFAGSGTTLKAAKELGRRFVGIEINPEYVEICHRRIAQEVLNLFPENNIAT